MRDPDWQRYGYSSLESYIEAHAGDCPPDPLNPKGELCTRCGQPAQGQAFIDGKRYCHGEREPTCYELADWPMPPVEPWSEEESDDPAEQ